jgi:hypothetical protein
LDCFMIRNGRYEHVIPITPSNKQGIITTSKQICNPEAEFNHSSNITDI